MKKSILCLLLVLAMVATYLPCSAWAAETVTATVETAPVSDTAYKLGICAHDGITRYFNGQTESQSVYYRLAATENIDQAVDVYLEDASGGVRLYFMNGRTKTYIRFYERSTTNATGSLELVTRAPAEVYTYDTGANTLMVTGSAGSYYMGTYSTYTTLSVSNVKYITGANASKVDVSQFPARLYKVNRAQEPVTFSGVKVVLGDTLGVRFQTPVHDGTVTVAVGDAPAQEIAAATDASDPGKMDYCVNVYAENMLQPITAALYGADGQLWDTQIFDFAGYVAQIQEMDDQSQAVKDLAQAALTYCQHAANTAGKYTGSLTQVPLLPEDAFTAFPWETGKAPAGTRMYACLTEACALRIRMTEPYDVAVDGHSAELTQKDGLYECGVPGILPQDYGVKHTFTISKDGEQLFSGGFSVLSYIGACIRQGIGTQAQQTLLRSMYHYYAAASAVAYPAECTEHTDADNDEICDRCGESVIVVIDFYAINDLHGKIVDTAAQIGVDELSTYLNNAKMTDDHLVLLSAGDMWQGSSESSLTEGYIVTDWMSGMGFTAMTLGNHEFDWGGDRIRDNRAIAQFPFLAINIYESQTDKQVDYCQSSVLVERDGVQIGIIGAIGNCYSSISSDKVSDIYFKTGSALTALVKAEAEELRSQGADLIVYTLHGDDSSTHYDTALSNGYVDLVFEGHTHQDYLRTDQYGVYHLQNGGDNKKGISHVEIAVNTVADTHRVTQAELVDQSVYENLPDDPIVQQLLDKYAQQIASGAEVLGTNRIKRTSAQLCQIVAELYYQVGLEKWGAEYDIVLGGGYLNTRSPYDLPAGEVTYSTISTLFPFDNELVLCSVSGQKLRDQFVETSNSNYYISYGDYGEQVIDNINLNATYYVVVDAYTSQYAPNGLTEIARFGTEYYARDLMAQYVRDGGLT